MSHSDVIADAVACLREGGIVAYPTESVFGLGCDPHNEAAVRRILALKQRSISAGLILIGGEFSHLLPYMGRMPETITAKLVSGWPAPITWIVPASRAVPAWISGDRDTVAVRVPELETARALCAGFGGALVSTSANPSGKAAARSADDVKQYFPTGVELIIDATTGGLKFPSEIRDALSDEILRPASD